MYTVKGVCILRALFNVYIIIVSLLDLSLSGYGKEEWL
ncbi:hypothetical protein DET54_115138 [Paenibacillus pabuli]|uniref:Uncharacterized protein n=1 Tax=Paenibacillus pabuli TaxID=1472 RepID=A0ABX9BEN2_9BACL|nr:hypothetical protein DET54_115138 [Paenibacillus pabuli]